MFSGLCAVVASTLKLIFNSGNMKKFIVLFMVVVSFLAGIAYRLFQDLTGPLPVPYFDENKYWGPGNGVGYKPDKSIKPFTIKFSAEEVLDLKEQLHLKYRLTEPLEGVAFEYGFNSYAMEQYLEFWHDDYLNRWTEREAYLNSLPQFTTEIQGLRIHFIHAKPNATEAANKTVVPLLLLHGWPGSVREFYDFIPMLTQATNFSKYVYEVIAPSLVGYGWSQPATKPGFNAMEMGIVMRNLMLRLGHKRFLVQGGDWGAVIGSDIATLFQDNVIGFHSNMCVMYSPLAVVKTAIANYFPDKFLPSRFFYGHHFPLWDKLKFLITESGYFHLQATKPDTIGTVLLQTPVSLAVYILEKFQMATGPGTNHLFDAIANVYTLDAVFDNLMIYYMTNSATSAARIYAESASPKYLNLEMDRVQSFVPMGCARFKHDLPGVLSWALKDKFPNLIYNKYFQQGTHFAALELPVMLYIDFNEFVEKINM